MRFMCSRMAYRKLERISFPIVDLFPIVQNCRYGEESADSGRLFLGPQNNVESY